MTTDDVLTAAETATELGLTPVGVRYRCEKGMFPGARVAGGVWLIPRSAVEQAKASGPLRRGPKVGSKRKPRRDA